MITDYDCWKAGEDHVTVEMIVANLTKNAGQAKAIITRVIPQIPREPGWPCHEALKNAIMTDKKLWPARTRAQLQPLLKKYF
jgi:5'-methylthioadenosine phosphorylase